MRRPPIQAKPTGCETCDTRHAPFGYLVSFTDEDGRSQAVQLWFCREHRGDGEAMLAASKPALREPSERKAAEPPRQGVLL